jgi:hypothetical protein
MERIRNHSRRFGSAESYWLIRDPGGDLVATDTEVNVMAQRAAKNPEDIPPIPFWRRILRWGA